MPFLVVIFNGKDAGRLLLEGVTPLSYGKPPHTRKVESIPGARMEAKVIVHTGFDQKIVF